MQSNLEILPFNWQHWPALWQIRRQQLADDGIYLAASDLPLHPLPVNRDGYEWDYHHMAEVYLCGAGGFWLAWLNQQPVGQVAAQDMGGAVELRRMYVMPICRRLGIGSALVAALLAHCRSCGVKTVELWTDQDGLGRRLYNHLNFRVIDRPGSEFFDLVQRTNYDPGPRAVRMRYDLDQL
jgi:GNAT superfamily N-acetyltransferase